MAGTIGAHGGRAPCKGVSMESGLDGRNNVGVRLHYQARDMSSQWSPA